jgi:hypothetical protein
MVQTAVFGAHALEMRALDLAVVPIGVDRQPRVAGFNRWKCRPGSKVVAKWAEEHPTANIGVMPGLCGRGAVAFDCDSIDAAEEFQNRFGKSNLRVVTSRGQHLWYDKVSHKLPGNLRKFGLNIDIKAGTQITIAPPSLHESGHVYALADGCDWAALNHLNELNLDALNALIDKRSPAPKLADFRDVNHMRDGSRKLWINDRLCASAWSFGGESEMLEWALILNAEIGTAHRNGPLEVEEVVTVVTSVWRDRLTGKIENWNGIGSMFKRSRIELDHLMNLDHKSGGNAYALLHVLRDEHSARCRRGETFAITPKAMADAQVMRGWTRETYEKVRDLLLKAGLLKLVTKFAENNLEGRRAAQYSL